MGTWRRFWSFSAVRLAALSAARKEVLVNAYMSALCACCIARANLAHANLEMLESAVVMLAHLWVEVFPSGTVNTLRRILLGGFGTSRWLLVRFMWFLHDGMKRSIQRDNGEMGGVQQKSKSRNGHVADYGKIPSGKGKVTVSPWQCDV
jgi:hypothetical protein